MPGTQPGDMQPGDAADAADALATGNVADGADAGDAGEAIDAGDADAGNAADAADRGNAPDTGGDAADAADTGKVGEAVDAGNPVFIFAGQSNMAGADAVITPDIVFTDADRQTLFTGNLIPSRDDFPDNYAWGPMQGHHCCVNYATADPLVIGPEVGFSRRLQEAGIDHIAIIKAWANFAPTETEWPWLPGNSLNVAWMAFVDERLAQFRQRGFDPRILGFVWDQGIDDAIQGPLASQYAEHLTELIAFLRQRFGVPDAPFVLARQTNSAYARGITGSGPNDPMALVRAAQVQVGTTVPRAAWIDVDDLPNVNIHHFSADNQLVIGRRFGDAYLGIRASDVSGP